jgi:hypothetical protein
MPSPLEWARGPIRSSFEQGKPMAITLRQLQFLRSGFVAGTKNSKRSDEVDEILQWLDAQIEEVEDLVASEEPDLDET